MEVYYIAYKNFMKRGKFIMHLFGRKKIKPVTPEIEEKEFSTISEFGHFGVAYAYQNVEVAGVNFAEPDLNSLKAGSSIDFDLEPDNEYDKNAIRITCDNQKLGYVHKGKLQNMISDWKSRGDLILAAISKINRKEKSIEYGIAFFTDKLAGKEKWDSLKASLTKTSKKDEYGGNRQDVLENANEDDILAAEYNDFEETYVLSNDYGDEIGELSKSISEKVHAKEEAGFTIIPVIDEIAESNSGKYGAHLTVYFKP